MRTIAFIPARGGSKGLPKKNIKHLCGKPLISWSIEQALAANNIDKVFVSTNCPEIATISKDYGAEVPFLRPAHLATDEASTESAMLHFCEYLLENNIACDNLLLIQATSPIRKKTTLDNAISYFNEHSFDSLLSVVPSHNFYWLNKKQPKASYDFLQRPRRQDILEHEQKFLETGSFYLSKFKGFLEHKNRLFGNIGLFSAEPEEAFEIDTPLDFSICEAIINSQHIA